MPATVVLVVHGYGPNVSSSILLEGAADSHETARALLRPGGPAVHGFQDAHAVVAVGGVVRFSRAHINDLARPGCAAACGCGIDGDRSNRARRKRSCRYYGFER